VPPADELVRAGLLEREGGRAPALPASPAAGGGLPGWQAEMAAGRVVCWAMSSSKATVDAGVCGSGRQWEAMFGPRVGDDVKRGEPGEGGQDPGRDGGEAERSGQRAVGQGDRDGGDGDG
jgi:hypothetical protein